MPDDLPVKPFGAGKPKRPLDLKELLAEGDRAGAAIGMKVPRTEEAPLGSSIQPPPVEAESKSADDSHPTLSARKAKTDNKSAAEASQRVTLELPKSLFKAARKRAVDDERPFRAVMEDALRVYLKL